MSKNTSTHESKPLPIFVVGMFVGIVTVGLALIRLVAPTPPMAFDLLTIAIGAIIAIRYGGYDG